MPTVHGYKVANDNQHKHEAHGLGRKADRNPDRRRLSTLKEAKLQSLALERDGYKIIEIVEASLPKPNAV